VVDAAFRTRRIQEIPWRWYNQPAVYLVLAVLLAILTGQLLSRPLSHVRFRTFKIPAGSMEPTLRIGDYLIADTWAYRDRLPDRGDVIIFQAPEDPSINLVKRCVAVGGDTIEIRDKKLSINGRLVLEPYAQHTDPKTYSEENESPLGAKRDQLAATKIPPESCFCLGDNRDFSYDSRFFGAVSHDLIRAKPLYLYRSRDTSRIGQRIH
jgi:signal peptidase I